MLNREYDGADAIETLGGGKFDPKNYVCFTGAGFTYGNQDTGFPSGPQLMEKIAQKFREEGVVISSPASDTFRDQMGAMQISSPALYRSILIDIFGAIKAVSWRCHLAAGAGFRYHITTNYDRQLSEALRLHIKRPLRFSLPPVFSNEGLGAGDICFIHGGPDQDDLCEFDPDSIVATADDYRRAYRPGGLLKSFLNQIFMHKHILFMGCGLADETYIEILQEAKSASDEITRIRGNSDRRPNWYALTPVGEYFPEEASNAGIQCLRYNHRGDYSGLDEVLEKILGIPQSNAPSLRERMADEDTSNSGGGHVF